MIKDDVLAVQSLCHVPDPPDDVLKIARPEKFVEEYTVRIEGSIECLTHIFARDTVVGQVERLVSSHRHESKG